MAIVIDPKDVQIVVGSIARDQGEQIHRAFMGVDMSNGTADATGIVVVSGSTGRVVWSATGDYGERLVELVRRRFMAARGYAKAPQRKRPRRLSKKIRARFGVAHHRDYHRELVRWLDRVLTVHDDAPRSVAL